MESETECNIGKQIDGKDRDRVQQKNGKLKVMIETEFSIGRITKGSET